MENFKITILIPTKNRSDLIGETLESIMAQSYSEWECFIVDDLSEDDTQAVVNEYVRRDSRFSYYLKSDSFGQGPSGARNCALDIAKNKGAQYLQFFDDDDLMHPNKLELQVAPFQKDETLDLTICRYKRFSPGDKENNSRFTASPIIKSEKLAEAFLFGKIKVNSGGPIFKAHLFEQERFDEELFYGEERELLLRIFFRYRPRYRPINKILFFYRFHENSLTQKKVTFQQKTGANAAVVQKLWHFMYKHEILDSKTTAFFLRKFLLENHNKEYVRKIYEFTLEDNKLKFTDSLKFRFLIKFHSFYIKMFYKLLLFNV